jgi:hypothetical protein
MSWSAARKPAASLLTAIRIYIAPGTRVSGAIVFLEGGQYHRETVLNSYPFTEPSAVAPDPRVNLRLLCKVHGGDRSPRIR